MDTQAASADLPTQGADQRHFLRAQTDKLRQRLANSLKAALADSGLSQTRAAKLCGTDQPSLSRVLSGQLAGVSLEQLLRWLLALGLDVQVAVNNQASGNPDLGAGKESSHLDSTSVIYLDHHATTPVDPRVAKKIQWAMVHDFGNPNSVDHVVGRTAYEAVEAARTEVGALINAPAEWVTFTAGSSHALRIALAHATRLRSELDPPVLALSRVEHRALIDAAEDLARTGLAILRWIDVDAFGRISPDSLARAVEGAHLTCVMAANNEVGTVYPVAEIAVTARAAGGGLLIDASQAAGRIPLDLAQIGADYMILTAHKMYGPKGVGALVSPLIDARDLVGLPFAWEGTANVPGIVGLGEACRLRRLEMKSDTSRIRALRDRLEELLRERIQGLIVNGDRDHRLAENLHFSAPGADNDRVTMALRRSVAISTGAACTSGAHGPSHVLRAMGLAEDVQASALRIGVGKFTTEADIELAAAAIAEAISQVRADQEAFA
jgi:cysteine desulfurase